MLHHHVNAAADLCRRRHSRRRWLFAGLMASICTVPIVACQSRTSERAADSDASVHLRPVTTPLAGEIVRGIVYVPVYSSIPLGLDIRKTVVELTSTVSVRNTSAQHPIILEVVRYHDSAGKPVRDYIGAPSELPPVATTAFVVREADTVGGPGAKFVIRRAGAAGIDEPLMEAVMVGRRGNAGISFVSVGRRLKTDSE